MENLNKDAGSLPIFYSWVNVTCHPEWLKYFDVDPFQIPTVVFYYPEKERQALLIGQFDESSIQDHQERFLKGKLAGWQPRTKHSDMKMESKDCNASFDSNDGSDSSDLDDEILKEILAEEEERRKKAEEEEAKEDPKKKKGKKKGKKGKKGKKSAAGSDKDEL